MNEQAYSLFNAHCDYIAAKSLYMFEQIFRIEGYRTELSTEEDFRSNSVYLTIIFRPSPYYPPFSDAGRCYTTNEERRPYRIGIKISQEELISSMLTYRHTNDFIQHILNNIEDGLKHARSEEMEATHKSGIETVSGAYKKFVCGDSQREQLKPKPVRVIRF
jgi:hypothetical protein